MKKNSLRYKALKRCAQINENVAVDLLKLKRSGVDVKNFINQVENIDAPYSILERYNFMSIDDVDLEDIKESLMELGASRRLLSEAVYKADDKGDSYTLRVGDSYTPLKDNISTSGILEEERKRIAVDEIDDIWWETFDDNTFFSEIDTIIRSQGARDIKSFKAQVAMSGDIADYYARTLFDNGINSIEYWKILLNYLRDSKNEETGWFNYMYEKLEKKFPDYTEDVYERVLTRLVNKILTYLKRKITGRIGIGTSLEESKKELDPKADLKKRQAELDKIVDEIKNDANLDKKSAKKYTTRLKKIKDLKELKKAKMIVKKLSKLYPEAADLLNESMVLKIVNAVRGKKSVLNENLKINNFHISTYSLKELKECYSKVAKNINVLKRKLKKCSLNESYTASDIRKIKEELKKQTKLYGMLDEEISWKMLILQKGGLDNVRFLNEGEDSKEDKNTDEDSASTSLDDLFNNIGDDMEDDIDKEEKSDKKDEDKNDSDEDVELDSITITMKSEDAANGLKDALIEKGVPEDVIDIEEAEDEEDESKNESVKYSNKFMRLFEDEETDDSDNKDDEDDSDDSNDDNSDDSNDSNDSNNDSDNDNTDDKAYNVTLTDTDYVNSLKDVMVDEYGYTEDEFWDSIGGKPIDDEDDSDKDKDKDDEDDSDNKDDEDDDTSELDSIGADIFGEQ